MADENRTINCERCGRSALLPDTPPPVGSTPPVGWAEFWDWASIHKVVSISVGSVHWRVGHLCPECFGEFKRWLDESGYAALCGEQTSGPCPVEVSE